MKKPPRRRTGGSENGGYLVQLTRAPSPVRLCCRRVVASSWEGEFRPIDPLCQCFVLGRRRVILREDTIDARG